MLTKSFGDCCITTESQIIHEEFSPTHLHLVVSSQRGAEDGPLSYFRHLKTDIKSDYDGTRSVHTDKRIIIEL